MRPRVGVSRCLLGDQVRYDGRDKRAGVVAERLGLRVDLVPVCPEVELGLGVPRDPMHLEGDPRAPRLIITSSGRDLSGAMEAFAERRAGALARADVDGFVLKSRSPSCGLGGVPVYDRHGHRHEDRYGDRYGASGRAQPPPGQGRGLFAAAVAAACPYIPLVDEDDLANPSGLESFVARVFAHWRRRERGVAPDREPGGGATLPSDGAGG